jgi:hypothetical protein
MNVAKPFALDVDVVSGVEAPDLGTGNVGYLELGYAILTRCPRRWDASCEEKTPTRVATCSAIPNVSKPGTTWQQR